MAKRLPLPAVRPVSPGAPRPSPETHLPFIP